MRVLSKVSSGLFALSLVTAAFAAPGEPVATPTAGRLLPQPARQPRALLKPNIRIDEVWIGGPWPQEGFGHLDRPVHYGEKVTLVCSVEIAGKPEPGWKLRWVVDGQEFCGSGDLQLYPPCYFEWPTSTGDDAYFIFWSNKPGKHTFGCVADVLGEVKEGSERDNAKRIAFEVEPLDIVAPEQIPVTDIPRVPQLRRSR